MYWPNKMPQKTGNVCFPLGAGGAHVPGTGSGESSMTAVPANDFLNSLGVNTHVAQGLGWATYTKPWCIRVFATSATAARRALPITTIAASVHGVRVDIVSGPTSKWIVRPIAPSVWHAVALAGNRSPNEPNTGRSPTRCHRRRQWHGLLVPVANFQADLYAAVKGNPRLMNYPVFHVSEGGAEYDNVGLQYLTIPSGAGCTLQMAPNTQITRILTTMPLATAETGSTTRRG